MSYKTYTTEAIVCGSTQHNTSDKNFLLFSKDAGMVFATARSVREERSKQRYALQDFSRIRVSLLKGKHGWRVGSVESQGNPFLRAESRTERAHINFFIAQLRRYVHGEVPLPRAYADIEWVLSYPQALREHGTVLERLFLLRLLSELGYIAPEKSWEALVDAPSLEEAQALYAPDVEGVLERAIKSGAQASHL